MNHLSEQIQANCIPEDPDEKLAVHKAGSHSGYLTYDGIDVNGKRVSDEILEVAHSLESQGSKVTKFSLIGYLLGGLVSRYALGILYDNGFFENVQPIHFVTFCTPHVGVLNPGTGISTKIYNTLAPYFLAATGSQLFLTDRKIVAGKEYLPLLQWMSDPSSKFYKALELFRERSLYANAINDRRTSWYTAFVSALDPFNSMVNETLSAYSLRYIKGYEPTIVEFSKKIDFNRVDLRRPQFSLGRLLYKGYVWLKLLSSMVFIMPIYSLYVIYNSIKQRVKMTKRLKEFARDNAEGLKTLYEVAAKDDTLTHLNSMVDKDSDQKESDSLHLADRFQDQTETFVDSIYSALNSASYYDYHHSVARTNTALAEKTQLLNKTPINLRGKKAAPLFKVKLTSTQEDIVKNFNRLEWKKYPVIIKNTKATHAAIIYRHEDPSFKEGKLVVNHFVSQVFAI